MIKTTIGEFRAFLDADFGDSDKDDGWFEEIGFYIDGSDEPLEDDEPIFDSTRSDSLPPEREIKFCAGVIVFPNEKRRDSISIEPLFKRWRKSLTHTHVLVRVPNDRMDEFRAAAGKCGVTFMP